MDHFAPLLKDLRRKAGFYTSYAFYHRNGGRGRFPFTYPYYAKIERGEGLPRVEWLELLLGLLRVTPTHLSGRRLMHAYLQDLIGNDISFDKLITPLLRLETDREEHLPHGN